MPKITQLSSWNRLVNLQAEKSAFSLQQAFTQDASRVDRFSCQAAGIYLDYSKHLIDNDIMNALLQFAEERQLPNAINALQQGEEVNTTENRQALHHLLRHQGKDIPPNLQNAYQDILAVKQKMASMSRNIIEGRTKGCTGKPFTDIVNIGIGGSDLGPAMVYQALNSYHQEGIKCHFVSNICAHDILECLQSLDPHSTLFIVASKSFTTLETLSNANTAKQWLCQQLGEDAVASHFFAVSSKPEKAAEWGINTSNVLPFWDWVGGRYSVWSAIGFPLSIGLGPENFEHFLAGAAELDQHFFSTELKNNLPVIMALLGIWYSNFWQKHTHAVIPYDHRLRRFSAFLQQLEMESTGKTTDLDNQPIDYSTCPDLWGEAGSNAQHSFFQKFHQGSEFTPIDFIAICKPGHDHGNHQDWLLANCLAQSRALMLGQEDPEASYRYMPGNRPSSTFLLDELTPQSLGALIASYEHKVYTQSVLWNINAFDQWGVELGKTISKDIKAAMQDSNKKDQLDPSSQSLLDKIEKHRT